MNSLGFIENQSDLDIAYLSDDELAGVLKGLGAAMGNPKTRSRALRALNRITASRSKGKGVMVQIRQPESKNMTGKALFEHRLDRIDSEIRKKLVAGQLTLSDFALYSVKIADSNHIEIFKTGDNQAEGYTNIDRSQLPNNNTMLVTSIVMLSGTGAGATVDDGKIVDFDEIHSVIANGNFTFKNGQKIFFENMSNSVFKHKEVGGLLVGEYKLENPKIIQPNSDIIYDVDIPAGIPANTFIKVVLNGVITTSK